MKLALPFTTAITSTSEIYNVLPRVTQGTDDFQRIGNQIQVTGLYNTCNIFLPVQGSNSSQSVVVDVYYLTCKGAKQDGYVANVPFQSLLNNGDGTNVGYTGTWPNAQLPINKTDFTLLKHKRVKLQKGGGDPNSVSGASTVASTDTFYYYANWKTKIPCPKKLNFEKAATNFPSNYYPFMMIGFHNQDAYGDTAVIFPRIYARSQSELFFKDA